MSEFRSYPAASAGTTASLSNKPQNLLQISPETAEKFSAEVQKVVPLLAFKKKKWYHRQQELKLKKQLRGMIAQSRPLFVIEPLKDDDKLWFTTGKGTPDEKNYVKLCANLRCLVPATKVERCVEDSTYQRWLCDQHSN